MAVERPVRDRDDERPGRVDLGARLDLAVRLGDVVLGLGLREGRPRRVVAEARPVREGEVVSGSIAVVRRVELLAAAGEEGEGKQSDEGPHGSFLRQCPDGTGPAGKLIRRTKPLVGLHELPPWAQSPRNNARAEGRPRR